MKSHGHSIDELDESMSASAAARAVLSWRLTAVPKAMSRVTAKSRKAKADVHRLRVACRRAVAALEIFQELLPEKKSLKLGRELKSIRRSAGDARDLDVLIERLKEHQGRRAADNRPVRHLASGVRQESQALLVESCARSHRQELTRRIRKVISHTKWRDGSPEPTFGDLARRSLQALVKRFFETSKNVSSDMQSLHELRISGKRLRYAIEFLSVACDPDASRKVLEFLADLQNRLGALNDHVTALELFQQWRDADSGGASGAALSNLCASEEAHMKSKAEKFAKWWSPQRQEKLRRRLDQLLVSPPQEPIRKLPL